jgi:DNA modification methylase
VNTLPTWRIIEGNCRAILAALPEESVQMCVTSPPYFGLRDYGHDAQIGLEPTPDKFVAALVQVFREVRRVLRDDGTVWLNLGDSYAASGGIGGGMGRLTLNRSPKRHGLGREHRPGAGAAKHKDLLGIPWMTAFALRADGWYLRSDVIWAKPNPMPESVTDRPTKAHEYLFLLTKRARYFYDADAIREDAKDWTTGGPGTGIADTADRYGAGNGGNGGLAKLAERYKGSRAESDYMAPTGERHTAVANGGRNRRSVWTVATQPYAGAHFATFPPKLVEPCILAGSREGDTVLDPFSGSGTTGMVALRHDRSYIGIELNPDYVELSRRRITDDSPLINSTSEVA